MDGQDTLGVFAFELLCFSLTSRLKKWIKAYVETGMSTVTSPSCAVYLIACNTIDPRSQQPEPFEVGIGYDSEDLGVRQSCICCPLHRADMRKSHFA